LAKADIVIKMLAAYMRIYVKVDFYYYYIAVIRGEYVE